MTSQQVKLGFVRDPTVANAPIRLRTLQLADGKRNVSGPIFVFAEPDQDVQNHTELMKVGTVKSALEGIDRERNPFITLKKPLIDSYLDGDLNPSFNGRMLDELYENPSEHSILNGSMSFSSQTEQLLAQQVAVLTRQLEMRNRRKDLNDLVKKFSLQPFGGKSDGKTFMRMFEDECLKYELTEEKEKVEALRAFCRDSALGWWEANRAKLSVCNWSAWKSSFLAIFGPKTWRDVRLAYGYVWKFGAFRDYAIEKERLLLELDSMMSENVRIDNIVIGLPLYIQDELKRDELKSVNQLVTVLTQLNPRSRGSFQTAKSSNWRDDRVEPKRGARSFENEKKPCMFCELIGFKKNFHPVEKCRNRAKAEEAIKSSGSRGPPNVNLNATASTSDSDSDSRSEASYSDRSEKSRYLENSGN